MDFILDLIVKLSPIISAIITSIITFFVTKYTYQKSRPLDKLEITYNRIYYPILRLIKNEEEPTEQIVKICQEYLNKYEKYLDNSTQIAFKHLKTNINNKEYYMNFKNNIFSKNTYLRQRLGYLQSNFFEIYKYFTSNEKRQIRLLLEILILYISVVIYSYNNQNIRTICTVVVSILLIILIVEIAIIVSRVVINFINKQKSKLLVRKHRRTG